MRSFAFDDEEGFREENIFPMDLSNCPVHEDDEESGESLGDYHVNWEQIPKFGLRSLAEERAIVWLRDPTQYAWLREGLFPLKGKSAPPPRSFGVTAFGTVDLCYTAVGYGVVHESTPTRDRYWRRVFYTKAGDDPSFWPDDAINISAIQVGQPTETLPTQDEYSEVD